MAKEIKSENYGLEKIFEGAQDFLPLLGTDYVEFYVGNAKQAAHFYKTAFGFYFFCHLIDVLFPKQLGVFFIFLFQPRFKIIFVCNFHRFFCNH